MNETGTHSCPIESLRLDLRLKRKDVHIHTAHAGKPPKRSFLSSTTAWAVWLFIHLMSIVGVKNRLFIFVDWMWSYFTYDPSLRIIIKPLKRE